MTRDPEFPRLRCAAGHRFDLSNQLTGCPICRDEGIVRALEVEYALEAIRGSWDAGAGNQRHGFSIYEQAGALPSGSTAVSLGEGGTPLLRGSGRISSAVGGDVWLKLEGHGPTGSYKDRMNAIAVSMARRFDAPGVVCSSTGNQGVAMAAYAAAASLPAVVLLPNEAPDQAARQAAMHGATVLATPWDVRPLVIEHLVGSRGWTVSNRNDPRPWANPYGLEGYRSVAYEIVRELKHVPEMVVMPTCGGDGLYGIWKGFRELREAGVVDRAPRMVAVQPAVSDSLVRAVSAGDERVAEIPLEYSIALSLTDRKTSDLALRAVRESGGTAIAVTEAEIVQALGTTSAVGLYVEPASAAGIAALAAVRALGPSEVVCVLTASGVRWPSSSTAASVTHVATLDEALEAIDRDAPLPSS